MNMSDSQSNIVGQDPALIFAEKVMGNSLISGYLKEPPALGEGTWDGKHVWEIVMKFDDRTPQDECRLTAVKPQVHRVFRDKLTTLYRLQVISYNVACPTEIQMTQEPKRKWEYKAGDKGLERVLNDSREKIYKYSEKLVLGAEFSKGEVTLHEYIEDPVKITREEEEEDREKPRTIVEIKFYASLSDAYLLGQEFIQMIKMSYA